MLDCLWQEMQIRIKLARTRVLLLICFSRQQLAHQVTQACSREQWRICSLNLAHVQRQLLQQLTNLQQILIVKLKMHPLRLSMHVHQQWMVQA